MYKDLYRKPLIKEALKGYINNEIPVGCLIVKDSKIISKSYNTKHSTQISLNHAEIISISKACSILGSYSLDKCSIYVSLEPCTMCGGAIMESRIRNIYIGTSNPYNGFFSKNYYSDFSKLNITWLNDPLCEFLLNRFFNKMRKKL